MNVCLYEMVGVVITIGHIKAVPPLFESQSWTQRLQRAERREELEK